MGRTKNTPLTRVQKLAVVFFLVFGLVAPVPARANASGPQPQTGGRGRAETNRAIMRRSAGRAEGPRQAPPVRRRPRPVASSSAAPAAGTAQPSRAAVRAAPQTPATSFLGAQFIDDSVYVPPDSMGAVGPTQFLVGVNGRIRTFTKAGVKDGVLDTTLDDFFSSSDGASDPRVRYDRRSGRWFVTAIDVPPTGTNNVLIAVSSDSAITNSSTWTFFSIPSSSGVAFDFPTLGIDEDALYVGVNAFEDSPPFDFVNSDALVIRKSSILGAGPIVFTEFANLINPSTFVGLWSPMGVDNFDAGTNAGYFVGVDFGFFGRVDFRRISDPGGSPSISSTISVSVPATVIPAPVPQPGSDPALDGLDDRLSDAVIRDGSLWTSDNIELNPSGVAQSGGGRDGVRWYEFQNVGSTPSLRQSGTIFDPATTTPFNYWMPSVMVSGQGHAAFGFSRASADATNGFAGAALSGRLATDALGTASAPSLIQGSTFGYDTGITTPERWGDYSNTSLDPNDDMTMWTIQEYASATDKWGVRVVQLKAPAPTVSSGGSAPSGLASTPLTVAGTGFFEPGCGFPNHLTASIAGGPTVDGVMSVSPTRVDLDISTVGVTPGPYDITITNPDGQSAVGTVTVAAPSPPPPVPHDFAVLKVRWPKTVAFAGAPVKKTVAATIQNRSPHTETVLDRPTLSNLIRLNVDSVEEGAGLDAAVALSAKQKTFPATIKPKGNFKATFDVTFSCVVDPVKNTKDSTGHEDYTVSASVHHDALDGANDTHSEDDVCPHDPLGIDPNPDGSITDKGCGAKKGDGTLGATMFVDLYTK